MTPFIFLPLAMAPSFLSSYSVYLIAYTKNRSTQDPRHVGTEQNRHASLYSRNRWRLIQLFSPFSFFLCTKVNWLHFNVEERRYCFPKSLSRLCWIMESPTVGERERVCVCVPYRLSYQFCHSDLQTRARKSSTISSFESFKGHLYFFHLSC